MLILDVLFIICYGPFQNKKNGRFAAVLCLMQILGVTLLACANAILYILGVNLSAIEIAIMGGIIVWGVYYLFNTIYVKNTREIMKFKYSFLVSLLTGILVFLLLIVSSVFMIYSFARFS